MKTAPKVRPSISVEQVNITCRALDTYISNLAAAGGLQTNKAEILSAIELRRYYESFRANISAPSRDDIIKQFLAEQAIINPGANIPTIHTGTDTINSANSDNPISPLILDTTKLTDDQRYDLLKLQNESTWSEQDKIWMLNVGTLVHIRRSSKAPVETTDL